MGHCMRPAGELFKGDLKKAMAPRRGDRRDGRRRAAGVCVEADKRARRGRGKVTEPWPVVVVVARGLSSQSHVTEDDGRAVHAVARCGRLCVAVGRARPGLPALGERCSAEVQTAGRKKSPAMLQLGKKGFAHACETSLPLMDDCTDTLFLFIFFLSSLPASWFLHGFLLVQETMGTCRDVSQQTDL